ncbi:hypothetical protein P280DRAFT_436629 [Massarina eburnea CBS 473.64]|uniref:Zn(2)-C6 fungal-type domain-containing protein n=1 Tax=Massarina eburnea CBS 473.64 TaxID=1395130 RepID=A0A6A6RKK5_9PLEO|nr:hypothetical protein P280DRAFT_436629 [Massarina eburnea CBS 473.64]
MESASELPSLQHAETDGTGPVRRRRPALSCVECRRRKVKCDRDKPCGPCRRTESPTCTYRHHPRDRHARSTMHMPSENLMNETRSSDISFQSPALNFASRITPYGVGLRGSNGIPSLSSGCDDTISELANKIRSLESRLAAFTHSETESQSSSGPPPRATELSGHSGAQFVKSKFYGESHWNNCLEPYDSLGRSNIVLNANTNRTEIDKASELYVTVAECKRMARTIKATRMLHPTITSEVQESVPPKDVCDELVQCYFRTFEGVFRVLHIPSFLKDCETYWINTTAAKPSVLIKMLLVFSIGVPFYTGPEQPRLRASCTKWIQAAESWLSAPHRKSRLNMAGLQIQILLLLARQVCSVDGDLVWISSGSLLRTAMHLGLHRDPTHFGKMSHFHAEMRRRLWATVMEMTVQSSLDMGMPLMISPNDYDTRPPGNLNDDAIADGSSSTPLPRPANEFTQCSIQIAFYESLPLRVKATSSINSIQSTTSYEETLRLGSEILQNCRRQTAMLRSSMSVLSTIQPNAFQIKLFDTLIRRFALCLHRPYFNRSKQQPKYYYSRKLCLDISVAIAAPASDLAPGEEDDWTRLAHRSIGFVKSFYLHSLSTIYLELISQLQEQHEFIPSSITSVSSAPLPPQLQVYRQVLANAKDKTRERLRNGETNAKGYTWLSCAVARIDALASNADPDVAVIAAAKLAVTDTAELMRTAYFEEHGKHIDLSQRRGPFVGRDHGRGDGADDVTGTPRVVNDDHAWCGEADVLDGGMQDVEWERLMRDESLGFGWGFEGSPESWFGWGWDDVMSM